MRMRENHNVWLPRKRVCIHTNFSRKFQYKSPSNRIQGSPVAGSEFKAAALLKAPDGPALLNTLETKYSEKDESGGIAPLMVVPADAKAKLPAYAQPVFVRLIKSAETTGTFKYRKADLVVDGFDPSKTGAALYVRGGAAGYQKLTAAGRNAILKGESRL